MKHLTDSFTVAMRRPAARCVEWLGHWTQHLGAGPTAVHVALPHNWVLKENTGLGHAILTSGTVHRLKPCRSRREELRLCTDEAFLPHHCRVVECFRIEWQRVCRTVWAKRSGLKKPNGLAAERCGRANGVANGYIAQYIQRIALLNPQEH